VTVLEKVVPSGAALAQLVGFRFSAEGGSGFRVSGNRRAKSWSASGGNSDPPASEHLS